MNVTIKGTRIELSDTLKALVEDKLNDALIPLGDMNLDPVDVAVEIELTTRRHPKERVTEQRYRAEANLSLPGRLIRAEGTGPTIRRAVVEMKHVLNDEIKGWRGRVVDAARGGARIAKEEAGVARGRKKTPDAP